MVVEKFCSVCKKSRDGSEFWEDPNTILGLGSRCKQCSREYYATEKWIDWRRTYQWEYVRGFRRTDRVIVGHCEVGDCEAPVYATGYCRNHYAKSRRGPVEGPFYLCECSGEEQWLPKSCKKCTYARWRKKNRSGIRAYVRLETEENGRTCTECNCFKDWEQFYMRSNRKTRMSKCKECMMEAQRRRKAEKNAAS